MLRLDKNLKTMAALPTKKLSDEDLLERSGLQRMIINSPEDFMAEIGEEFMIIGEEIPPSGEVLDRLDLLAIDPQGAAVIIELKRNDDKRQLLQAISYASMVAKWEPDKFVDLLSQFAKISKQDAQQQLTEFVDDGMEQVNQIQRIILIAEDFDYGILSTAEWLREKYEVDIRCYRLRLTSVPDGQFLTCNCIFPATGIAEQAVRRGRRVGTARVFESWEGVLQPVESDKVRDFFSKEIAGGADNRLKTDPQLKYRVDGTRRWSVTARQKHAAVWQYGRFSDDEQFWKQRLGNDAVVKSVNSGKSLAFNLTSAQQFASFKQAVSQELLNTEFPGK